MSHRGYPKGEDSLESAAFTQSGVQGAGGVPGVLGPASFYRDGGARAIMRAANFPDELLPFLQMEGLAAMDAVCRHECDSLVELGCYDGRALEVARAAGVRYLGVDVNPGAIDSLNRRIGDEGLGDRARAVLGDALHCQEWSSEVTGERPLHLLPFNLVGNFTEPEKVLAGVGGLGGLALISVFNEEPWTTEVRRAYYTACGIGIVEEVPGPYGGVLFRGDQGFRSQSFSSRGVADLLSATGAATVRERTHRLGRCITVRLT
ncbi:hypothetical protein SAMN05192584_1362 [Streptomyces pini]|uniref:Methyltransferase domain-containing protein n=1 Tax=Streptomyces pini TaxID=1520580 RepID=A0A1I4M4N6_9ACTN|nr:hypothetical protein SAMN05192584_1362 [Streptomyces pini]